MFFEVGRKILGMKTYGTGDFFQSQFSGVIVYYIFKYIQYSGQILLIIFMGRICGNEILGKHSYDFAGCLTDP